MEDLTSRTSMLREILEIEAEIKQIKRNPTYRKIVHNLKRLNRMGFGDPVVRIPSPNDLNQNIEVWRHSKNTDEIMNRYEERQLVYDIKIQNLRKRRKDLEKRLFI